MKKNQNILKNPQHQNLDNFLNEANIDLGDLKTQLLWSIGELRSNLELVSKDLKVKIHELNDKLKTNGKATFINFYHDHKDIIDEHLKTTNTIIQVILDDAKEKLKSLEKESEGDKKEVIHKLYKEVVQISRKYNHRYNVLKIKLKLENAGINIKKALV